VNLLFLLFPAMLSLTAPTPLPEAVSKLSAKTAVGSVLRTVEWAQVPVELRESAFFSAGVTSAQLLQSMKDRLDTAISLGREQVLNGDALVDRSSFIGDLKKILAAHGYAPEPGTEGSLVDLMSRRRLGLIFDQQIQGAQGYAGWKMGQDPDMLDQWPAQELIRVESRQVPRNWINRWVAAGGQFHDLRMIALKTSPVWTAISRFDRPWPPFDFGSGMGLEDISRTEAIELGVLAPDAAPQLPQQESFTENLAANIGGMDSRLLQAMKTLFGDRLAIEGGRARWNPSIPSI